MLNTAGVLSCCKEVRNGRDSRRDSNEVPNAMEVDGDDYGSITKEE